MIIFHDDYSPPGGYYYFRQLVPGTYRLATFGAEHAGCPPFWARPEAFDGDVARTIRRRPPERRMPDARSKLVG